MFRQRVDKTKPLEVSMSVSKNGRYIIAPQRETDSWLPTEGIYGFTRPRLKTPFPVVAARRYDSPKLTDTRFFAIKNGRLITMGDAPEINSQGPVLWRGKPNYWLFDNENTYSMRDPDWVRMLRLYRIDPQGHLRFIREWPAPKGKALSDMVDEKG